VKRILPLLFLLLIVAVSGCIGQPERKVTGTSGIIITNFAFDINNIIAGEEATLSLDIENVGGAKGSGTATIYGVPIIAAGEESTEYTWVCDKPATQEFEELYPPDPVAGTPGEAYLMEWTCTSPTVPTQITQQFEVDVEYNYSTDVTGTLTVAKREYLKTLSSQERQSFYASGGITQLSVSAGPIGVDVVAPRPLVIEKEGEEKELKVRVVFRNVGSGKVKDDLLQISDLKGISCEEASVELVRGEQKSIICKVSPGTFEKKATIPFSFHLSYAYVVHSSATITIQPEVI
jgi:hypothetical protein